MDWDDLRHFLALARHGGVRPAASALGVSHSTVVRRLDALEARLGTRLFDRHRDGYALTEVGARMRVAVERIEDEVCALERDVSGQDRQLAGPVHVTCCDEYVAAQILHDLRPFCAAHPDVELSVDTDTRPFNLAKGEADLALRALAPGAELPAYVVARRVAPVRLANYVARTHAERLDPKDPQTRWLSFQDRTTASWLVETGSYPNVPLWGSFPTLPLLARAAAEGLGIAMLPTYVGEASPDLVRLPHDDPRHLADLWLLHHVDLRDNVRVQAVKEVIRDGFARRSEVFAGWSADAPRGPADEP